jgi:hypothetical protein
MTSVPAATPAAAPGRPTRQQRGYVMSFGVGRVCAEPGCRTMLSRYNKWELCYSHADELDGRGHRDLS